MESVRLRAILARTPGLVARHLKLASPAASDTDLVPALLAQALPRRARTWLESPDQCLIDSDLRSIEANGYQILCCSDPAYPPALACLPTAPAALYVRGDPGAFARPALAIVGASQASTAGLETARQFAAQLGRAGLAIVSGLAAGIDCAAQQGVAMAGIAGIAACTAGFDRIRPARSAQLATRICDHGCVVSPFAPGTPPQRYHFPLRNRLIAGLASAVLVIEADPGSGALAVVAESRAMQRRIFAVPGSIRDPHAQACNSLIRGGATLVRQSKDILADLNLPEIQIVTQRATPPAEPPRLDNKYEMLLDAAGFEPVDIDILALRTGWSGHVVASMLLLLELQGRIAPQPGGWYCRLS